MSSELAPRVACDSPLYFAALSRYKRNHCFASFRQRGPTKSRSDSAQPTCKFFRRVSHWNFSPLFQRYTTSGISPESQGESVGDSAQPPALELLSRLARLSLLRGGE